MKKHYFNLDNLIKKAQYDDVPDDWGADDYNTFEDEQVFQDREGYGDEEIDETEEESKFTIEPSFAPDGQPDGFQVIEHGVYEESSDRAGQYRRSLKDFFPDLESAEAAFPNAEVLKGSTKEPTNLGGELGDDMPQSPPSGFDPSAAGERWDFDY